MTAEELCGRINALPERERMEALALLIAVGNHTEDETHHYPWDEETCEIRLVEGSAGYGNAGA